jgi:hypothetical protein
MRTKLAPTLAAIAVVGAIAVGGAGMAFAQEDPSTTDTTVLDDGSTATDDSTTSDDSTTTDGSTATDDGTTSDADEPCDGDGEGMGGPRGERPADTETPDTATPEVDGSSSTA